MITAEEAYASLTASFKTKTGHTIQTGSAIDMFFSAVADGLGIAHQKIEDNKNPHIYSALTGSDLDDVGIFFNCPRETNESDATYLYRLMHWVLRTETSNETAIGDALYNLTNASYAKLVAKDKGCNTATIYIIPNDYDDETIAAAVAEVKEKVKNVIPAGLYIEYTVPNIRAVTIYAAMSTTNGDLTQLKYTLATKIAAYVNGIAPGDYLKVGTINKMGCNETNVDYFCVASLVIDDDEIEDTQVLQELKTKFLFDRILWIEEA